MNILNEEGGVFLLNKPYGWTSFDLVAKIRNLVKKYTQKKFKVGHAGTLDPLATGLMIVCIGKETKNISLYTSYDKEYIATVNFSGRTISHDLEQPIVETFDYSHVTHDLLLNTINTFIGEISQIPPVFSAKKTNGKRAYLLARQGKEPILKPVNVYIHFIKLIHFNPPEFTIHIKCSKGTYIRSLVRDIGQKLTGGAYLTSLERIAIGNFKIENSLSIENFEKMLKNGKIFAT
jgi:tRNA pseudouridine55 synthase